MVRDVGSEAGNVLDNSEKGGGRAWVSLCDLLVLSVLRA